MQRNDYPDFEKAMGIVAENFGHRALSAEAMRVWILALVEHPYARVRVVLLGWMQQKTKFPVIADLTRACSELATADRERIARAEGDAFDRIPIHAGPTEFGKRALREIRAFLREGQRAPGKWWAREIVQAHAQGLPHPRTGHPLSDMQVQFARAALGDLAPISRIPGEDDEAIAA